MHFVTDVTFLSWNEICVYSNVFAAHLILKRLLFCAKYLKLNKVESDLSNI